MVTGATRLDVAANHDVFTDNGFVFVEAVIIHGDRAAGEIGARADIGVADIAEMAGLHTFMQVGILDLDKVTNLDLGPTNGSRGAGGRTGR